jgi:hypothetical protein
MWRYCGYCCVCCPQVLCEELGIADVGEVFEWIDLDTPIGSASISQVSSPCGVS